MHTYWRKFSLLFCYLPQAKGLILLKDLFFIECGKHDWFMNENMFTRYFWMRKIKKLIRRDVE
jgi:hypothetical protein